MTTNVEQFLTANQRPDYESIQFYRSDKNLPPAGSRSHNTS